MKGRYVSKNWLKEERLKEIVFNEKEKTIHVIRYNHLDDNIISKEVLTFKGKIVKK